MFLYTIHYKWPFVCVVSLSVNSVIQFKNWNKRVAQKCTFIFQKLGRNYCVKKKKEKTKSIEERKDITIK